ncbi:MAG TPA: hypothetical protein VIM84_08840 [Gemmatimonadales bacterium]
MSEQDRADAAALLRRLMNEISERYYCAGWLDGLEYALWARVIGDQPPHFGMGTISGYELRELARLSQRAGGWWYWSDEQRDKVFAPLEEWTMIYAALDLSDADPL